MELCRRPIERERLEDHRGVTPLAGRSELHASVTCICLTRATLHQLLVQKPSSPNRAFGVSVRLGVGQLRGAYARPFVSSLDPLLRRRFVDIVRLRPRNRLTDEATTRRARSRAYAE